MKVVEVIVLFVLVFIFASNGSSANNNDFGYIKTKLEYLQNKMDVMESAMREADQKLHSVINQQLVELKIQWEKEQKVSRDIGQLTKSIDQKLQRIDQKLTHQNEYAALQQTQAKQDREFFDEMLAGVTVVINQLGQTMAHNLSSIQDQWKSIINKRQKSIDRNLAGVSQAITQLNQETDNKLNALHTQLNELHTEKTAKSNHEQIKKKIQKLTSIQDHKLNLQNVSYQSCLEEPSQRSGKYLLQLSEKDTPFMGFCDQDAYGGGWLVVQYRYDGSLDFFRNWTEYRNGFGSVDGEFWLGLEHLHQFTSTRPHELLVELKDFNGIYKYARYDQFKIANETKQYKLKQLGKYTGTAGDALRIHKDMKFSTMDQDNDEWLGVNCASEFHGAWWYKKCHHSNLNGLYNNSDSGDSIDWSDDENVSHAYTRMLIREI